MQVDFNTGLSRDFSQFLKKDTQKDTTNRSSPILIGFLRLPMASSPKQDRQINSLGVSNQESQKVEVPVVQGQLLSEIGEQSSLL